MGQGQSERQPGLRLIPGLRGSRGCVRWHAGLAPLVSVTRLRQAARGWLARQGAPRAPRHLGQSRAISRKLSHSRRAHEGVLARREVLLRGPRSGVWQAAPRPRHGGLTQQTGEALPLRSRSTWA